MSDRSCDDKPREETTYFLEMERDGGVSDRSCHYKMRAGVTYSLNEEGEGNVSECGYE
jgi:hypothetical protein